MNKLLLPFDMVIIFPFLVENRVIEIDTILPPIKNKS